jgi:hypothetical protein
MRLLVGGSAGGSDNGRPVTMGRTGNGKMCALWWESLSMNVYECE